MSADGKLRVHLLIDSLETGGAENLLAAQAEGMLAAGLAVSASTLRPGEGPGLDHMRELGLEPRVIGTRSLTRSSDRAIVERDILRTAPDLVHTHLGYADVLGTEAAARAGVPAISTIHIEDWGPGLRDRIKERVMARARRRHAARVIAVSESLREAYLNRGFDSPERVLTVRNGIRPHRPPRDGARLRTELGIEPDETVVTMLSVLREGKGHAEAAAAIAALTGSGAHPRMRLLVAGDGPARESVAAVMAPLGDRALVTGHRDDPAAVIDATDILLHPSRAEALPGVVLEAMASAVAVLATDVGGIPELIEDGVSGILVPAPAQPRTLATALERLLHDPALRDRLGNAARERYRAEFTLDAWMSRLLPVYDEVVRAASSSS